MPTCCHHNFSVIKQVQSLTTSGEVTSVQGLGICAIRILNNMPSKNNLSMDLDKSPLCAIISPIVGDYN